MSSWPLKGSCNSFEGLDRLSLQDLRFGSDFPASPIEPFM